MAYTIILVDDEDDVRGRIASKMAGREDVTVIGSAANGYDALDLLEETIPDVVVTDIKMPFIDGIELTRIIRDRYPTVKVAIISGYDDYTYLKEAINLDVVAYLSKPISRDKIDEFLDKITQNLDEENEHIRLKENMRESQIKDRVIHHFLSHSKIEPSHAVLLSDLGIKAYGQFVVVAFRLRTLPEGIILEEKRRHQCFRMIEEQVGDAYTAYSTIYGQDIITIIEAMGEEFHRRLDLLLYKIVGVFSKYLAQSVALGVSNRGDFLTIGELYRQSQWALDGPMTSDATSIHYFSNTDEKVEKKTLNKEDSTTMSHNMRYLAPEDFTRYMTGLKEQIERQQHYDYAGLMITINAQLIDYADSVGGGAESVLDFARLKNFIEQKDLAGFMTMVSTLRNAIHTTIVSRKAQKSQGLMTGITAFIRQNFQNKDISMEQVCDEFNISISYLCALFKKETDTTFNRYLVAKRIDHAKLLLESTDNKMVNVAEACGYKDVYYFSHSFKKATGQSPKEYRKHAQS